MELNHLKVQKIKFNFQETLRYFKSKFVGVELTNKYLLKIKNI